MGEAPKEKAMELVRTEGLEKIYQEATVAVHALRGVDLTVEKGEFTALAGPSGSGKTTLLNLIGGLDVPTRGRVVFEGRDLSSQSKTELSRIRLKKLGFVFQSYNLIPVLSAVENVEFVMLLQGIGHRERREQAEQVLREVGLGDMMYRRPDELSGGQQQRVAVARAIVSRPSLILADEPTANLDSATGSSLLDMMKELNDRMGITFLFSTHDQRVMERARRLVLLQDGVVVEEKNKDVS